MGMFGGLVAGSPRGAAADWPHPHHRRAGQPPATDRHTLRAVTMRGPDGCTNVARTTPRRMCATTDGPAIAATVTTPARAVPPPLTNHHRRAADHWPPTAFLACAISREQTTEPCTTVGDVRRRTAGPSAAR